MPTLAYSETVRIIVVGKGISLPSTRGEESRWRCGGQARSKWVRARALAIVVLTFFISLDSTGTGQGKRNESGAYWASIQIKQIQITTTDFHAVAFADDCYGETISIFKSIPYNFCCWS